MAINPLCDFCKKELTDFGGLVFSPPNEKSEVKKWHMCKPCYKKTIDPSYIYEE